MFKNKISISFILLLSVVSLFGTKTVLADSATNSDVGTNIITKDGTIYTLTADGKRRPYTSGGAFLSYGFNSFNKTVPAKSGDLSLQIGPFIAPRDGSIVCSDRGDDKGTCYLITEGKKAGFTSETVFKSLGFSFKHSQIGDVSFMENTSTIATSNEAHRPGVLINNDNTLQIIGVGNTLVGVSSMEVLTSWGYNPEIAVWANSYDTAFTQSKVLSNREPGVMNF